MDALPNDCADCGRAPALEGEAACLDCATARDADDHAHCDCDECWRRAHAASSIVRPRGGLSRFGHEVLGWGGEE